MDNTIIQQGRFTSTGRPFYIPLRMGVDWMTVYNYTVISNGQVAEIGFQYYWQRGLPYGHGIAYLKSDQANADNLVTSPIDNFFPYDTSLNPAGVLNLTITAISAAAIPVATTNPAHGLRAGDVVRLSVVNGGLQISSVDFTVGYNTLTATTFSLDYMAQIAAATAGGWRKISWDPIFYPRRRTISKITRAAQAVVTMTVTHGFQVGQAVRLVVPPVFGMVEMDGLLATIVAIDTTTTTGNTITLNVDSSAFTPFTFPTSAATPFTYAEVVPVGEDTAAALLANVPISSDATENTAEIGMILTPGEFGPGGQLGDVMFWQAGSVFSTTNL